MILALVRAQKRKLQIAWVVLALTSLGLLLAFRGELLLPGRIESSSKLWILAVPFLMFGAIHLLLMYESWFGKKGGTALEWGKRIFFGLAAAIYTVPPPISWTPG